LLPGVRLLLVAQRLLAQQPDPPRLVTFGDLMEIYLPSLVIGPVLVAGIAVLAVELRAGQPVPLDLVAKLVGVVIVGVALVMTLAIRRLKQIIEGGVMARAEILDATRLAGHVRVEINGQVTDRVYRSMSFELLNAGDHITVLVDPQKETVLLPLGRVAH
jgi:hypothetical protein